MGYTFLYTTLVSHVLFVWFLFLSACCLCFLK